MMADVNWTEHKLEILHRYLNAYTTALKNQRFKLMYVDAFAGTGTVELRTNDLDGQKFIDGSARIAASISKKLFDKLIFLEKNPKRCNDLEKLKDEPEHKDRDIEVENTDANIYLRKLCCNWKDPCADWRGVLFLDPFATQVEWETVEAVASTRALDTWIWFPVSAISRLLPVKKRPEDVRPKWAERLTKVFGDKSWETLYRANPQPNLFGDPSSVRDPGVRSIRNAYKEKLRGAFGNRLLEDSRTFTNSKNVPLFDLIFCAGNEKGIGPAHRIASHLLKKM
ncbi:MAG: three-Cys-motif partner protein TcmP [Nitrospira sp.]|nr:three-Cys-motif partner protein TcmP [Nitrospira sp.]